MLKFKKVWLSVLIATFLFSLTAVAAWAKKPFEGVTIRAALIGGGNYEKLYEEFIPKWEKLTGAKVVIVAKMSHFELDKKFKLDFAAGAADYDIMTNHTILPLSTISLVFFWI